MREIVGGSRLEVTSYAFRVHVPNSLDYVFPREASQPREVLIERLEDGCGNFIRFARDAEACARSSTAPAGASK